MGFTPLLQGELDALPIRSPWDGFKEAILEVAQRDIRVMVIVAGVGSAVSLPACKERLSRRYIEVGASVHHMVGMAAGLAHEGKIPFVVAPAALSPGMNWGQIRTSIALSQLPIKVIGVDAGVCGGASGAVHQMIEDITLMRVLPHMHIEVPVDAEEMRKVVDVSLRNGAPTYIRCGGHAVPCITTPESPFVEGRAEYLVESEKPIVAIIGAGPILTSACMAAKMLKAEGVEVSVLNVHSIKPMDIERVKEAARVAGAVVSVEDHQILGGVGGTLAEIFAQNTPVPMEMIAVHDRFGQSGTPHELAREYRLTAEAIIDAVKRVLTRR